MARSNAGGGHGSRVVVDKPIKIGAGAKGINPGWVGQ